MLRTSAAQKIETQNPNIATDIFLGSDWWQLNFFWNFQPGKLGEMIQFDDHTVSNGLVQPPGRLWFLNQGPI